MRKLSIGGGLVLRQMLFLAVIAAFGAYLWLLINQLRDVLRQALVPGSIGQEALAAAGAQAEWLSLATPQRKVFVLRLAGIYGPGRNQVENLRNGTARRIVKEGQVFNRIHVEDISRAIAACLGTDAPGGVFNVTDDEPAPPQDVVTYGADLIGVPPPTETPFAQADFSPMALSFWGQNKRVANRRLREELGVDLAFPTYREGLRGLV